MGMRNYIHSEATGDVDGSADGEADADSDANADGDAAVTRCVPCKVHVAEERNVEETTFWTPLGRAYWDTWEKSSGR